MNTKNDIEKKLEELSPTLLSLKNKELFRTPANYFDAVLPNIQNKIKQSAEKNYLLSNTIKWTISLAIVSIALLLIFKFSTDSTLDLQPLNNTELYAAVSTYYFDDIDETMIEDNLLANNIIVNSNNDENETINYLIDNDEGDILNYY